MLYKEIITLCLSRSTQILQNPSSHVKILEAPETWHEQSSKLRAHKYLETRYKIQPPGHETKNSLQWQNVEFFNADLVIIKLSTGL